MSDKTIFEKSIEATLFASRWLMAPIYLGMVGGLFLLLFTFASELFHLLAQLPDLTPNHVILGVLSLIDLSLAGNLLLIVIFSGYENFVSTIDKKRIDNNQQWKGSVDFSTIKLKLIASIVAISGIHLLKVFMDIGAYSEEQVKWMVIIHVIFVISGVFLALMDRISVDANQIKKRK